MTDAFFAQNRLNWDDRADIHIRDEAGGYRIDAFLNGEDNLHDIEHAEIGDVSGLRIAHLQCHIGIDTLCECKGDLSFFSATPLLHFISLYQTQKWGSLTQHAQSRRSSSRWSSGTSGACARCRRSGCPWW